MSKKQGNIILTSFAIALFTLIFYAITFQNGVLNSLQDRVADNVLTLDWFNSKEIIIRMYSAVFAAVSIFQIITLGLYLNNKRTGLMVMLAILLIGVTIYAIYDRNVLNFIFALPAINILLYLYDLKDKEKKK